MAKVLIGNIKGPQGVPGEQGIQGEQGNPGEQGTRGTKWYTGTAITGISTTGTVFATGLSGVLPDDYYLNEDDGHVYRCIVGGDDDVAKWVFVCTMVGGGGSSYDLDTTLLISGAAADAKAVGDKVTELEEADAQILADVTAMNTAHEESLAKKPENVKQLFEFNGYNGDINSLEVGMYVYFRSTVYSDSACASGTGGGLTWTKIEEIDVENKSCRINTTNVLTNAYKYKNRWIPASSIKCVLSKDDAEYISALVGSYSFNNGGLNDVRLYRYHKEVLLSEIMSSGTQADVYADSKWGSGTFMPNAAYFLPDDKDFIVKDCYVYFIDAAEGLYNSMFHLKLGVVRQISGEVSFLNPSSNSGMNFTELMNYSVRGSQSLYLKSVSRWYMGSAYKLALRLTFGSDMANNISTHKIGLIIE